MLKSLLDRADLSLVVPCVSSSWSVSEVLWTAADSSAACMRKRESETMASKPFKGVINIDVRDSVPDWEPYEQPKAPDGAPNVIFIVWDDTGFGAL